MQDAAKRLQLPNLIGYPHLDLVGLPQAVALKPLPHRADALVVGSVNRLSCFMPWFVMSISFSGCRLCDSTEGRWRCSPSQPPRAADAGARGSAPARVGNSTGQTHSDSPPSDAHFPLVHFHFLLRDLKLVDEFAVLELVHAYLGIGFRAPGQEFLYLLSELGNLLLMTSNLRLQPIEHGLHRTLLGLAPLDLRIQSLSSSVSPLSLEEPNQRQRKPLSGTHRLPLLVAGQELELRPVSTP
jgi:hypothetical protein